MKEKNADEERSDENDHCDVFEQACYADESEEALNSSLVEMEVSTVKVHSIVSHSKASY